MPADRLYYEDKNGRARDGRGRFLSARRLAQLQAAERGEITQERRKGRTLYRDRRGRLVPKDVAELQPGGPKRIIRRGRKRRVLRPETAELTAGRPPKAIRVLFLRPRWESAIRVVMDNPIRSRSTYLKWRTRTFRITPEGAGGIADVMHVIYSEYLSLFTPHVDSPQLFVSMHDTKHFDLIDANDIDTVDEELGEELHKNDALERAAQAFNAFYQKTWDTTTSTAFHGKERDSQDKPAAVRRSAPRRKPRRR